MDPNTTACYLQIGGDFIPYSFGDLTEISYEGWGLEFEPVVIGAHLGLPLYGKDLVDSPMRKLRSVLNGWQIR